MKYEKYYKGRNDLFSGIVLSAFSIAYLIGATRIKIPKMLSSSFLNASSVPQLWGTLLLILGIILVIVFFITSSDSGSLVIDTITAGGKVDAPVPQRVFWAVIEGVIAIALLLGGGLVALQAMAVSTGLPFAIVLMIGCISLVKGLMSEPR